MGTGNRSFSIEFTRGSSIVWVNGTYSKSSTAGLSVDLWDVSFDDAYINVFCITSWGNTTLYFYDNDTLRAYSPEAEVIQYRKQGGNGVHVVGVKIDGGGSTLWKNFTYSIAVVVGNLELTMFDWETGAASIVSVTVTTSWANATITATQDGRTIYTGTD